MNPSFISRIRSLPQIPIISILVLAGSLPAQDVEIIAVIKSQSYEQDIPAAPTLESLEFEALVDASSQGDVKQVLLNIPGGTSHLLWADEDGLTLEHALINKTRFDHVFQDGTYHFQIDTAHDGTRAVMLELFGDTYPTVPRLSNFAAAQAIDSASGFTLEWDRFSNAGPLDLIILEMVELLPDGTEQFVFETDLLDPSTTGWFLPPGLLHPGASYRGALTFAKVVSFDETYVPALGGYLTETAFEMRTLDPADASPPWLLTSRPWSGQSEVPTPSVIAFDFNEPMDTSAALEDSLHWSPLDGNNFSYEWSEDGQTLFCIYATSLPTGTAVSWTLNPFSGTQNLRDAAGNPLAFEWSGTFQTEGADPGAGPDVLSVLLTKEIVLYLNENLSSRSTGLRLAKVETELRGINTLLSLEVVPSPDHEAILLANRSSAPHLEGNRRYAGVIEFETFFPDMDYELRFHGARDGQRVVYLLMAHGDYPEDPMLENVDEIHAIDAANPFILRWNPMEGGTTNDPIDVRILNDQGQVVFETPSPDKPGALTGASPPQLEIPAGLLTPGTAYHAELRFVRLLHKDTVSYPGMVGRSGYAKVLQFILKTIGTPPPPSLHLENALAGIPRLRLSGLPNSTYVLEAKDNLNTPAWPTLAAMTTFQGESVFIDWDAYRFSQRYYRARSTSLIDGVIIQGTVLDAVSFTPVAGALIYNSLDEQFTFSDANGQFTLALSVTGDFSETPYSLLINATGFQSQDENRFWGNHPEPKTILLKSESPP